jgi:hypothetical protein
MVTDAVPLALAGDTLTHDVVDDVVHEHPPWAETVTVADPPEAGSDTAAVDSGNAHGTPGCVTVTLCPATVIVPVLGEAESFALAFTLTEPLPLPLPGEALNHAAFGEAVHEQPLGAFSDTAPAPPCAATDSAVGEAW